MEKSVKEHRLKTEDNGTCVIQWRPPHGGNGFEDREDETAPHTCCIVLSHDEVQDVGMTVDVVFGTEYVQSLERQTSYIPPPWCPTPPEEARDSHFHHAALALRSQNGIAIPDQLYGFPHHLHPVLEQLQPLSPLSHRHAGRAQGQPDRKSRSQDQHRDHYRSSLQSHRQRKRRKADVNAQGFAGFGLRETVLALIFGH